AIRQCKTRADSAIAARRSDADNPSGARAYPHNPGPVSPDRLIFVNLAAAAQDRDAAKSVVANDPSSLPAGNIIVVILIIAIVVVRILGGIPGIILHRVAVQSDAYIDVSSGPDCSRLNHE